jgi:hypothetical protein
MTPCPTCGAPMRTSDTGGTLPCIFCPLPGTAVRGLPPEAPAAIAPDEPLRIENAPAPAVPAPEMACPACGGKIREGAVLCRHCKTAFPEPARAGMSLVGSKTARATAPPDFGAPPVLPPSDPSPGGSGAAVWILAGVFGLIALICMGGALVFSGSLKSKAEERRVTSCRAAMDRLRNAVQDRQSTPGRMDTDVATLTGEAFLEKVLGFLPRCDAGIFRGPTTPWSRIASDGVVACDHEHGHRDGVHVLLKSGRVEFAPRDSLLHQRAMRETVAASAPDTSWEDE